LKFLLALMGIGALLIASLQFVGPNSLGTIFFILLFIWLPIFLLTAKDKLIKLKENTGDNYLGKISHILLALPIALLGLISIIIGVAIVAWVLYNQFIERQPQYKAPISYLGLFGIGPSLIGMGAYWIYSAIRNN